MIMNKLLKTNLKSLIKNNYFSFSKIISIKLPDLGEGTKEATIRTWFKKEGDLVEEEEKVVEVYTDKLVAELPSPEKGKILKINYKPEQACLVGKSLCEIEVEDENEPEIKNEIKIEKKCQAAESKNISIVEESINEAAYDATHKIIATPAIRFLINQYKINPKLLKVTGKGNRILKEDIFNYMRSIGRTIPLTGKEAERILKEKEFEITAEKILEKIEEKAAAPQIISNEQDTVVKLVGFQKAMTKTMTQSLLIPSFLYTDEFNVDKLVRLRKEMNKIEQGKNKFTFMPFFIKAVSLALKDFPHLNSHVNSQLGEDGYIYEYKVKKDHNISVAVDSKEGLVVPNIKRVQDKSIIQIQKELNDLRFRIDNKKLMNSDLTDGTFTLSNVGNIGGKVLSPIVLSPQVGIIGISKMFDTVSVVPKQMSQSDYDEAIVHELAHNKDVVVLYRKSVNLCISADHRIIDGATVARFFEKLKFYIENPLKIMIGN